MKSREDYLAQIRQIVGAEAADVMLLSLGNYERLAGEGLFDGTSVTPAIRANDTTDIWTMRGGAYKATPSRPFRSADLPSAKRLGCDLCLYSMTFVNDADADLRTVEAYKAFRRDACSLQTRHFLEVFLIPMLIQVWLPPISARS